jgi:alkylation response protein AidB-like acyl-CoA dehydrogenase
MTTVGKEGLFMYRYGEFITTDEDRMLLTTFREYVNKEVMPVRMKIDEDRAVFDKCYEGLVKLGIQKRGFSKRYGGLEIRSAITIGALTEEIARGDSGLALHSLLAPWVMGPAMGARNTTVMDKYMPILCQDEPFTCCMALTEPAGGANIEDEAQHGRTIRTIARLDGDEWVINGEKMWPSGAGIADLYGVTCTTDPELGEEGVAFIYVPADAPGLSFGKPEDKMGMKLSDINAAIYFDNVRVPREYRASMEPGMDWKLLLNALSWGRLTSAPMALGNAQAVLEIAIDYSATRSYSGKPVRNHTLQAAMLADLAIWVESARAYYLHVSAMFDNRARYGLPGEKFLMGKASAAKVYACDVTERVCNKAMELMGSYGYAREFHVEKYLRDSKIIQLWEGGPQLARLDTARSYYSME